MKKITFIYVCMIVILVLDLSKVFAWTVLGTDPRWKEEGDPPDGITRQTYTSFTIPEEEPWTYPPWPDWVYNGYTSSSGWIDSWYSGDSELVDGHGQFQEGVPFVYWDDLLGQYLPCSDGTGIHIGKSGTLMLTMSNDFNEEKWTEIVAEIIWYGSGDLSIGLDSYDLLQTINVTQTNLNDSDDPLWHISWLTGSISPQPSCEFFYFNFYNNPDVDVYIDRVATMTLSVPEPATICLLGLGGLMFRRRR
jgi:hypothetical protein